jgi:RNA polymerase sigma factor (sigma-70 family)
VVDPSKAVDQVIDRDLIQASLREPSTFGEIFERYVRDITRFLLRRADPEVVEDLVAETFITAFRVRHSYDPEYSNARPWLYGIATNVLRHHFRGQERRRRLLHKWRSRIGEQDPSDAGFAELDDRIDADRRQSQLEAALATLDPAARDALLLFSYAGLTYEEIALALDTPVGTVRSRISRSRQKLRELLSAEGATTE